jgi:hypothetical protein
MNDRKRVCKLKHFYCGKIYFSNQKSMYSYICAYINEKKKIQFSFSVKFISAAKFEILYSMWKLTM